MRLQPSPLAGLSLSVLLFALAVPSPVHPSCLASTSPGVSSMLEPHTASLLVDYFETFLRDKDIEAFHRSVMARYTEATLARLSDSNGVQARRASMLALGLIGSIESNATVARGLRDSDPAVRNLSQNALWAIWFRADTPENNALLQEVRDLIGRERYREAEDLAGRLIQKAPDFAEAYNQRAIALFFQGKIAESAADCRRVLERNPFHIGALGGLGQSYLKMGKKRDALATFRKALTLQPFNLSIKQTLAAIEAGEE